MHEHAAFSIGQLAKQTNCLVETIRYYEKVGLMHAAQRTLGGHRIYSRRDLRRLQFIKRGRELGFSVKQVRALLSLVDGPERHTCAEAKAATIDHIADVRERIADLRRLEQALSSMVAQCQESAQDIDDCPIIEALYRGAC